MFHHRFDNATLIARRCTCANVSGGGDDGDGGGGARRHVLISHPFTVSRMKHDRNHRQKFGPSYTPTMITHL